MTPPRGTLVVGYGNDLRRDDGLGPHVAAQVEALGLPGVRTLAMLQLTPELAEDLAGVARAVFVDARATPSGGPVEVSRIEPGGSATALTHVCDPRMLLGVAQVLYGRAPDAWWVTIAGEDFGLGEGLSEPARRHAREAVERIADLLRVGVGDA